MLRAMTSLPVPVSPTRRTLAREVATSRVSRYTARMAGLSPTTLGSGASSGSFAAMAILRSVLHGSAFKLLYEPLTELADQSQPSCHDSMHACCYNVQKKSRMQC